MSVAPRSLQAERKALLKARAEFDRTRVAFAVSEIRAVVSPPQDPSRMARMRPGASMLIGMMAPVFGATRVARWLRFASMAMMAFRVARNWNRSR